MNDDCNIEESFETHSESCTVAYSQNGPGGHFGKESIVLINFYHLSFIEAGRFVHSSSKPCRHLLALFFELKYPDVISVTNLR